MKNHKVQHGSQDSAANDGASHQQGAAPNKQNAGSARSRASKRREAKKRQARRATAAGAAPRSPGQELTASEILDRAIALMPEFAFLPRFELTPAQQQILGGPGFRGAHYFVRLVGQALQLEPAAFACVTAGPAQATGTGLIARQERAEAYMVLCDMLSLLLRHANDAYLVEQSSVVADARGVIRDSEAASRAPGASYDLGLLRYISLRPAYRILEAHERRRMVAIRWRKKGSGA